MGTLHIATVAEAVSKYRGFNSQNDDNTTLRKELSKLGKEDLIQMILDKENTSSRGLGIGELAKAILKDEELITLSNADVAKVIRELIPGANTTSKSIASYISKKREEWKLPRRIRIS